MLARGLAYAGLMVLLLGVSCLGLLFTLLALELTCLGTLLSLQSCQWLDFLLFINLAAHSGPLLSAHSSACLGLPLALHGSAFGPSLLVIAFGSPDPSISTKGLSHLGSALSATDRIAPGSSVPIRSHARLDSPIALIGCVRGDAALLVYDYGHPDSVLPLRGHAYLDSSSLLFSMCFPGPSPLLQSPSKLDLAFVVLRPSRSGLLLLTSDFVQSDALSLPRSFTFVEPTLLVIKATHLDLLLVVLDLTCLDVALFSRSFVHSEMIMPSLSMMHSDLTLLIRALARMGPFILVGRHVSMESLLATLQVGEPGLFLALQSPVWLDFLLLPLDVAKMNLMLLLRQFFYLGSSLLAVKLSRPETSPFLPDVCLDSLALVRLFSQPDVSSPMLEFVKLGPSLFLQSSQRLEPVSLVTAMARIDGTFSTECRTAMESSASLRSLACLEAFLFFLSFFTLGSSVFLQAIQYQDLIFLLLGIA